MLDQIEIEKGLIPYTFDILLNEKLYTFTVKHNEIIDVFTLDMFLDDEPLVYGEPIVYGVPLFEDTYKPSFPEMIIIPYDESKNENKVTYDNFNETVKLCIFDEGELPDG